MSARFKHEGSFSKAKFDQWAIILAVFEADAGFTGMIFNQDVYSQGATFGQKAWFEKTIFETAVEFDAAKFPRSRFLWAERQGQDSTNNESP